jgi:hypothetical protein
MDIVDIKRNGTLVEAIKPDDSSVQVKKIMAENELRIQFSLSYFMRFLVGDTCEVFGERYFINQSPVVKKESVTSYDYTVTMQAYQSDLNKIQYLFFGDDNSLKEADFSLMGNADTFIDLLIKNLQRNEPDVWLKGQVIPSTYKNLTFQNENCLGVLSKLAEAYETEFWIEGRTIHLTKRRYFTGMGIKQGRNKGLYDISRKPVEGVELFTRLYAFGSDKNIPVTYRNSSKRLKLPEPDIYLENNVDKYGVIERTVIFDDIYPQRTGKVSAVDAGNIYKFKDISLDFNLNDQLLPGTSPKITFNTGQLAGYTFEVQNFVDGIKEFTILRNKNENTIEVPSALLKVTINDEYVLTDIIMPDSYITAAEERLKAKAQQTLDTFSIENFIYQVDFDPKFLRSKNYTPAIGQVLTLVDAEFEINKVIGIVSTTRNIVNEDNFQIELGDILDKNTIDQIKSSLSGNTSALVQLQQNINTNNLLASNTIIGDLKLEQGTVIGKNIPTAPPGSGYPKLVIDPADGKVYIE